MNETEVTRTFGRTLWDLVYEARFRILVVVTVVVIAIGERKRHVLERIRNTLGVLVLVPATVGLVIGALIGLRYATVQYDLVIRILDRPNVRVWRVRDPVPINDGVPYVSAKGTRIRVAEDVLATEKAFLFIPHELHRLALVDPLSAYVHVRAVDAIVDELDKTLEKLTRSYVRERLKARYLARKRVNELLRYEDELVERLREELEREVKDDGERRLRCSPRCRFA